MSELRINPKYTKALAMIVNRCPYFSLLSMKIKDLQWGISLVEIKLEEKHLQPFGNVHGGAIASLVDAAAFWAVFPQVERGRGLTTVEMKINLLAPAQKGRLLAQGRCIKVGRSLALGEGQVKDAKGILVAHGTATMMVVPDLRIPEYEKLPMSRLE